MPPRRKRLDIEVMSSVVSERTVKAPIILKHSVKIPSVKKLIAKKLIAKKPVTKPLAHINKLVKADSSSSECNTPMHESPVLLAAITETPEKSTRMYVCIKCFNYIPSDKCVAYVTDEGLSYMHRTCEV